MARERTKAATLGSIPSSYDEQPSHEKRADPDRRVGLHTCRCTLYIQRVQEVVRELGQQWWRARHIVIESRRREVQEGHRGEDWEPLLRVHVVLGEAPRRTRVGVLHGEDARLRILERTGIDSGELKIHGSGETAAGASVGIPHLRKGCTREKSGTDASRTQLVHADMHLYAVSVVLY
jgi:hypothetical protein